MKRWLATVAIVAFCHVPLRADVTVTSTTTVEGGAAAMMGGAMTPRMVMRIKGMKARADVEIGGMTMASITDLAAKQMILLRDDQKTAHIFSPGTPGGVPGAPPIAIPQFETSLKPTGRSRTIADVDCSEFAISMKVNMANSVTPEMPADAAGMLKDVRMIMTGSMWVATSGPGVADYVAFQKASADGHMSAILAGAMPGMASGNMDRMMAALASAPGMPYLTEMTMTFEGSGQMVEMMKQIGTMKMTSKVTSVSTDAIPDDLFKVPEDYKLIK